MALDVIYIAIHVQMPVR